MISEQCSVNSEQCSTSYGLVSTLFLVFWCLRSALTPVEIRSAYTKNRHPNIMCAFTQGMYLFKIRGRQTSEVYEKPTELGMCL